MPSNAASGVSCSINLLRAGADRFSATTRVPCTEYRNHSLRNATTGAIQEIATIESQGACPFEIVINLTPNAFALVSAATPDLQHAPASHLQSHSIPHPHSAMTPLQPNMMHPFSSDSLVVQRPDYTYNLILDGINIGHGKQVGHTLPHTAHIQHIASRDCATERQLQFAPVDLVDPDEYTHAENPADRICEDEQVIKSLGTIRIDIFRCSLVSRPRPRPTIEAARRTSNQMKFSEKSKKACLSTTAGLAPEVPRSRPASRTRWKVIHQDPNPFLQFIFQYKPRSILEYQEIIPRAVQPAESSSRSSRLRNRRGDNVDDRISVVDKKEIKKEKKPNTDVIEINSESEPEEEDQRKAKRIKIEAKKEKTDKMPSLPAAKGKKIIPKSNFLDLTGSDDE
ncbi:hypothetical protein PCASD_23199 [Puccinia coronata f. sp. avenae]|uniref:DUF7918 domain-containing protein n=1 Tax=Puccinia coronata f. sp. avenae TaxID=200324 RepID=A0A2N5SEA5_9BASI|nr:hypothetical protein PCASD_23199 [Puccinia coronata f. sp. avenae]